MRVRFYQVECGDAASITFIGDDAERHHIFIDSGYERTYRDVLSAEIKKIGAASECIDLWIITHIHDDHIGGAVSYVKAIEKGEATDIVNCWWFNPPYTLQKYNAQTNEVSEPNSYFQGDFFTQYLLNNGKLPNNRILGNIPESVFSGLKVKVLLPSIIELDRLEDKYRKHDLAKVNYDLLTDISEPVSTREYDYSNGIELLWEKRFYEDKSIENLSSITMLTNFGNKQILWMADTAPSILIDAIHKMGFSKECPLKVDLVKVAHHGSNGNNNDELYSLISCDNFLVSANGRNKHCLPTKECLVRILKSTNRPPDKYLTFYFTYDNVHIRNIFEVDGPEVFERLKFRLAFPDNERWIDLSL